MERNMFKITATAAALAAFTASSAFAQSAGTIAAGLYTVTTEYTALTDPTGACAGFGVAVGGYTTGVASVFGNGNVLQTIVPVTTAASGTPPTSAGVVNLTCNYTALPKTLMTMTDNPYTATTACAELGVPASISGGTTTVSDIINENTLVTSPQLVPLNTANSFHIISTGATINIPALSSSCTVSTDALFVRTGS
jgi:hypothetical protein